MSRMRYRLALDLGSTSLGWAVFLLNEENLPRPKALMRAGVRIFPNSRESAPEGQQGESLAKIRREKRQARRRRDRQLKRKDRLVKALIKWALFPSDEVERRNLETLDPYALRHKGLTDALPLFEFGRTLFHLNQRRGFKSNRKTDTEDKNTTPMKGAIAQTRDAIDATVPTLGAWLYNRQQKWVHSAEAKAGHSSPNAVVRSRTRQEFRPSKRDPQKTVSETVYDFYIDRKMVEKEFDALWSIQQTFSAQQLTEDARKEIKKIIFFQRNLRPVHPGKCSLLPHRRRAYKAFPIVQQLRIYQEVSHLEILDDVLDGQKLTKGQRDKLAEHLCQGENLTFFGIRKLLGLPGTVIFNRENGEDRCEGFEGDKTTKLLSSKDYFGKRWLSEFSDQLKHQIVWKLLNTQSADVLSIWLQKKTGVSTFTAEKIMKAPLPSGASAYSLRATQPILAALISEVLTIDKAIGKAGLGSHSQLSHFEKTGELMPELPYYGQYLQRHVGLGTYELGESDEAKRWGRLSNPTVHVGLNQVRVVVNHLLKRYGVAPYEIIVELARPLKMNAKQRADENERNRRNRDANKQRREKYFDLFPNKRPSQEDIDRFKLWEELNPSDCASRCCPYTGQPISIHQLFSNSIQIEHILPFSRTADNSLNNKTLAYLVANRAKSDKTPHEAFGSNPTFNGVAFVYEEILQRAKSMKREKYMRFAPDGMAWWLREEADFPARALNDTQYLSKIAKEYLSLICPLNHIWATPGRLTSFVREHFGFDSLLNGSFGKNRNDHRHHAIDACVIGVTDRWLINEIARANARANQQHLTKLIDEMPKPWGTYPDQVKRAIENIWVSHKPDHSFEGQMFEERAYGFNKDGSIKQQKFADGTDKKQTVKYVVPIRHREVAGGQRAFSRLSSPYKGYIPYRNYCMEIIASITGDWEFDVFPRYVAYEKAVLLGWQKNGANRKQIASQLNTSKLSRIEGRLVMKLVAGDCIAVGDGEQRKVLMVTKMSAEGATFTELREANYAARASERGKAKKKFQNQSNAMTGDEMRAMEDTIFIAQIGVKELFRQKARRVTISPIGELKDPGFKE